MDLIQPMNIELVKIFKIKRDIKPETAIELAQDLQDLQHGTCKPLPLVLQRMEMVPPCFLPPESQGTDLLTYHHLSHVGTLAFIQLS